MRILIQIVLMLSAFNTLAQNGYIKLADDSVLIGYLRPYISVSDGQPGIEYWRTKNDKSPLKIPKRRVSEYVIKKDTFKVLHQYQPFQDEKIYFEFVDAKLKTGGKVNLYKIENSQNVDRVSTYTGGGLIPALIDAGLGKHNHDYIYVLEIGEIDFVKAVHSGQKEIMETLMDFFPEKYLTKYVEVKGPIKYNSIPDLVKLYNSK